MKAVIYCRTSTKDQTPENQIQPCKEFAIARGYEVSYEHIFIEQLSGFKDIKRPKYEEVLELAHQGKIQAVIVWALDRWVRNRDTLIQDIAILRNSNVKLHSVKESYLEAINLDGSLGRTLNDFLIGLIGSIGEMESQRKSERVKLSVRKKESGTYSYKGNRWGRKSLPKQTIDRILELSQQGNSIRQICKEVKTWRNGNDYSVSIGAVHKIITENKVKTTVSDGVQIISNSRTTQEVNSK